MITYYCIPSCDKCRAARKYLRGKEIAHQEIDMRKDGIDASVIDAWIADEGIDAVLNRRAQSYHKLSADEKSALEATPAQVLAENPTMLFRPVLVGDDGAVRRGKEALAWLDAQ